MVTSSIPFYSISVSVFQSIFNLTAPSILSFDLLLQIAPNFNELRSHYEVRFSDFAIVTSEETAAVKISTLGQMLQA